MTLAAVGGVVGLALTAILLRLLPALLPASFRAWITLASMHACSRSWPC
jgi:hypothetical protein